jgi:hypothetical protein
VVRRGHQGREQQDSAYCESEIRSCRGIHRTKGVRWRTAPPLRDSQQRRPSGRNDKYGVVDDVGEINFGEDGFSSDNGLKQNKMRLAVIG